MKRQLFCLNKARWQDSRQPLFVCVWMDLKRACIGGICDPICWLIATMHGISFWNLIAYSMLLPSEYIFNLYTNESVFINLPRLQKIIKLAYIYSTP